ncbi:hypothetical protein [Vibrio algicola]|uniref:hypothetical protein n=1 Tax=Vibrio algicola TaxID=2662262 RepID=UPI0015B773B1|nr:hypothetical protein [Vibrio algicola]
MNHVFKPLLYTTLLALLTPSFSANAISDDECAILMCAPVGFLNSNCKAAKKAMHKRILRGKPAIPRLDQCMIETPKTGNDDIDNYISKNEDNVDPNVDIKSGYATYIAPQSHVCSQEITQGGDNARTTYCTQYINVPEQWIKDIRCEKQIKGYLSLPQFCSSTITYQQAIIDGQLSGHVHYSDGHQGEAAHYYDDLGDLMLFSASPDQNESAQQQYQDQVNALSPDDIQKLNSIVR